jgi:hypothetical protein
MREAIVIMGLNYGPDRPLLGVANLLSVFATVEEQDVPIH